MYTKVALGKDLVLDYVILLGTLFLYNDKVVVMFLISYSSLVSYKTPPP